MGKYTKKQILKIAETQNVHYVRLQFTDMLGAVKAVEIPVAKLESALNGEIMFDGSSIEGFVRIKEADMYLKPDLDTWLILSFEDSSFGKVARLICDVYTPYGKPFKGDPRYILKRAIKKMKDAGIEQMNVGFEPEFYLFKNDNGELEVTDKGSYFDLSPIDNGNSIRREIALELERCNFVVQTAHHEVGNGQQEINFKYADVLTACDNLQSFKHIVKSVARKNGFIASFMPKPFMNLPGSGMHTNISIQDKEGNNLFYDEKESMKLSALCKQFIYGILKHSRPMSAVTNPIVNSYKRLISGFEAPCYACWSDANRSSMIRIPAVRGAATRAEIRSVDPYANPYLALAVIINAGLDGVLNPDKVPVVPPVYDNIFSLTREEREAKGIPNLPENLKDALKEMTRDPLMKETLGDHTYGKYLEAKQIEWSEFSRMVSKWEIDRYL